jgi:hypothetical protein
MAVEFQNGGANFQPVPVGTRCLLWAVAALDVMAVVWMLRTGDWLDTANPVLSIVTLGGHHWIVFGLALAGFLLLAVLAPATHGFMRASRLQRIILPVAGLVSVVALAGLLSIVAVVVGLVALTAVLLGARPTRIDVFRRR